MGDEELDTSKLIIACITAQDSCLSIIESAIDMADNIGAELEVVTAQPKNMEADSRAEDMKCLDRLSKKTGHEITVIYSDNPLISLVNYTKKKKPIHIFTGQQDEKSDFVIRLSVLTGAPITMSANGLVCTVPPMLEESSNK